MITRPTTDEIETLLRDEDPIVPVVVCGRCRRLISGGEVTPHLHYGTCRECEQAEAKASGEMQDSALIALAREAMQVVREEIATVMQDVCQRQRAAGWPDHPAVLDQSARLLHEAQDLANALLRVQLSIQWVDARTKQVGT